MPPRKKAIAQTLSAHIDESSGDEAGVEAPKKAPAKRASRAKTSTTAAGEKRSAPIARGRKHIAVEAPTEDEVDPIEDDEMEDAVVVHEEPEAEPKKRGGRKTAAKPEPPKKEPARKRKAATIEEAAAPAPEKKKRMTKKERDAAAKEDAEREIAETQFEPVEVDPSAEHNTTEDEVLEIAPTPTQVHGAGINKGITEKTVLANSTKGKGKAKKGGDSMTEEAHTEEEDDLAKPAKAIGQVVPLGRGRGKKHVSNESEELGGGELPKDLEKAHQMLQLLQTRYDKLREAKETEAEQALKKFQKNMKEKDEESAKVIKALQDDLEAQQKAQQDLSAETKVLKKKLATKETETSKLQTKVQELNKSLQDQQNESKIMSAKLVQAQNQLTQVQNQRNNAQVPGSAVKPGYRGPPGNLKANTGGAADDTWLAKAKEDLYADLCGLIIVNVKKENDSNVFECVQTGVNGLAVHFKLSVPNRHTKTKKTPVTQESKDPADVEDIEEDEIIFIPLFDEARDKTVIDLLPTYLRDEIAFQRDHMTKFYQKINSLFMMTINTQQQQPESTEEEDEDEESDEEDDEEEEEEEEEEKEEN